MAFEGVGLGSFFCYVFLNVTALLNVSPFIYSSLPFSLYEDALRIKNLAKLLFLAPNGRSRHKYSIDVFLVVVSPLHNP